MTKFVVSLYNAFVALEEEVRRGRIGSYGISSNSFALSQNAEDFLPYEDLITLAHNAASEVGNAQHSFSTIELPINFLEREGLKCASWAKQNGLRVLANRPLNAQYNGLMFRLADYDESHDYYHHLNELLDVCNTPTLHSLHTLLEQLDDNKHKFSWLGEYDSFLVMQIIPHIQKALEALEDQNRDTLIHSIDLFLQEYRKMVAYECSRNTRVVLRDLLKGKSESLQEIAIEFLLEQESVDYILVGMRKPSYVHEILAYKSETYFS